MRLRLVAVALLALPLSWLLADSRAQEPRGQNARSGDAKANRAADKSSGNKANKSAPRSGNKDDKSSLSITPEREAAVMTFVERNHPELVALLELLRSNRPAEYERAIRELHRVTEKLAFVRERDSQQYDLELKAWQIHSRLQLLVAKLKMSDSDDVRKDLRETISAQLDARAALLQHERQKAADRLERIENDIARLEANRQEIAERQYDMFTKASSAANGKAKAGGGKKPVARNPARSIPRSSER